MHNNKVYTILQHFDKNDFKQFNKYINSPYFNKSKLLIRYFDQLEKHLHSKNSDDFPKEKFWKKIFPNQHYNDVRFRKLSSDLLKIIEGYLSQIEFDKSDFLKVENLIKTIGNKGIEKLYQPTLKNANNLASKFPYRDSNFYSSSAIFSLSHFSSAISLVIAISFFILFKASVSPGKIYINFLLNLIKFK